jgi:hypothetical protein
MTARQPSPDPDPRDRFGSRGAGNPTPPQGGRQHSTTAVRHEWSGRFGGRTATTVPRSSLRRAAAKTCFGRSERSYPDGLHPPLVQDPSQVQGDRRKPTAGQEAMPPRWTRPPRPRPEAPSSDGARRPRKSARPGLLRCPRRAHPHPPHDPGDCTNGFRGTKDDGVGPDPRGGRFGGFARGTVPVVSSETIRRRGRVPRPEGPRSELAPIESPTCPGFRGSEGPIRRNGFGRFSRGQPPKRGGPAPPRPPGPSGPSGEDGGRSRIDGRRERQRQEGNDRSDAERLPTRGILRGV